MHLLDLLVLFSNHFLGCVWETYFIAVGYSASGMSVVVIALDRYLLMCHGYFASWSKIGILVLICWFTALVFPAIVIFPTLPDSIMLANGVLCHANFSSQSPIIKGQLLAALLIILSSWLTPLCSYASVFYKFNLILQRKEKRLANTFTLSGKSKKLLFKLGILTANSFLAFTPMLVYFFAMMISERDAPFPAFAFILSAFELGLFINPILIYQLDAKMKNSVNEMLGLVKKKKTGPPIASPKKIDQVDQIKLTDRRPVPHDAVVSEHPAELDTKDAGHDQITKTMQLHLRRNSTDTAPLEIKTHDLQTNRI